MLLFVKGSTIYNTQLHTLYLLEIYLRFSVVEIYKNRNILMIKILVNVVGCPGLSYQGQPTSILRCLHLLCLPGLMCDDNILTLLFK